MSLAHALYYDMPGICQYLPPPTLEDGFKSDIHIKIRRLLTPSSGYYGLWPEILREAGWVACFTKLRRVCKYFEKTCDRIDSKEHRRSNRAKKHHIRYLGNPRARPGIPKILPSHLYDFPWRSFGGTGIRDRGIKWRPDPALKYQTVIWMSKSEDVILEMNVLSRPSRDELRIGVIGLAEKVIPMFDYLRDNMVGKRGHAANMVEWTEMAWARDWI
ncbi:hypothetical protein ABKN59_010880 [Abortiporus biennis]